MSDDPMADYIAYQARTQRRTDTCGRTGLPTWACDCYRYPGHLPGGLERYVAATADQNSLVWSTEHGRWYIAPRMFEDWTREGMEG